MILEYRNIQTLANQPWMMLELRSEHRCEATMKRLAERVPGIFRSEPLEIFIPVTKRDLETFELLTVNYIFVRGNLSLLAKLRSITGVVGLVTLGESGRIRDAISVEDQYVQALIRQCEEAHCKRPEGIVVGSFVRILSGQSKDFCGIVEAIEGSRAAVGVNLSTRMMTVETPLTNLLDLSHVAPSKRVYYYSPSVEQLEDVSLIAEDMEPPERIQEVQYDPQDIEAQKHIKYSRARTVTNLVRNLIIIRNMENPILIAKEVMTAIREGKVRRPQNLHIAYCIIKTQLLKDRFSGEKNWRAVVRLHPEYKFSAQTLASFEPELGIPLVTQGICQDGRSKAARALRKVGRPRKEKSPKEKKKLGRPRKYPIIAN